MKKRKFAYGLLLMMLMLVMTACGKTEKEPEIKVDYNDATVFESELVQGADLTGKTVKVVVDNLEPQSAFGYNIWAGEHLNFVSSTNPGVEKGDVIIVKVTEIKSVFGSWIISYEKLKIEK